MGLILDRKAVQRQLTAMNDNLMKTKDNTHALRYQINQFISDDSLTGQAYSAIKEYYQTFHLALLYATVTCIEELISANNRYSLTMNQYLYDLKYADEDMLREKVNKMQNLLTEYDILQLPPCQSIITAIKSKYEDQLKRLYEFADNSGHLYDEARRLQSGLQKSLADMRHIVYYSGIRQFDYSRVNMGNWLALLYDSFFKQDGDMRELTLGFIQDWPRRIPESILVSLLSDARVSDENLCRILYSLLPEQRQSLSGQFAHLLGSETEKLLRSGKITEEDAAKLEDLMRRAQLVTFIGDLGEEWKTFESINLEEFRDKGIISLTDSRGKKKESYQASDIEALLLAKGFAKQKQHLPAAGEQGDDAATVRHILLANAVLSLGGQGSFVDTPQGFRLTGYTLATPEAMITLGGLQKDLGVTPEEALSILMDETNPRHGEVNDYVIEKPVGGSKPPRREYEELLTQTYRNHYNEILMQYGESYPDLEVDTHINRLPPEVLDDVIGKAAQAS